MNAFTNDELAACAAREVRQRRRVYPRLVARGRMTPSDRDREIAMMRAIESRLAEQAKADPAGSGRLL